MSKTVPSVVVEESAGMPPWPPVAVLTPRISNLLLLELLEGIETTSQGSKATISDVNVFMMRKGGKIGNDRNLTAHNREALFRSRR